MRKYATTSIVVAIAVLVMVIVERQIGERIPSVLAALTSCGWTPERHNLRVKKRDRNTLLHISTIKGVAKPKMLSAALLIANALFLVSRIVYRLWFSPLAHIPGPKIAGQKHSLLARFQIIVSIALTSLYCAYHDIIRGGQYVWVIEAMHQKYGPVVRIRPDVVHVNDPSFIE